MEELPFKKISSYRSSFRRFNTNQYVTKFLITNLGEYAENQLFQILQSIVDDAYNDAENEYQRRPYMYNLLLDGPTLNTPISVNLYHHDGESDLDLIMGEIEKLSQSDKLKDFLSNPINIIITTIVLPAGSAPPNPFEHFGTDESAKIVINNQGNNWCIFYALELTRLYHDQNRYYEYRKQKIKPPMPLMQTNQFNTLLYYDRMGQMSKAYNLMKEAGIPLNEDTYGIEWLPQIQQFYDQKYPNLYRIVCALDGPKPNILWKGPIGRKYCVTILLEEDHFNGLKSISKYYRCDKYCIDCNSSYRLDLLHNVSCPAICPNCYVVGNGACPVQADVHIFCDKCNRKYCNFECFQKHEKVACKRYRKCENCAKIYVASTKHICGEYMCRTCHTYHPPDRSCFVQPLKRPKKPYPRRICVYDFETSQDIAIRDGVTLHEVAFVSLRWTCTNCEDGLTKGNCELCETVFNQTERSRSWSWSNCNNPLKEFVGFCLFAFKKKAKTILFAHNGGRFDAHFILQELYSRRLQPTLIMTGLKIYEATVRVNKKYSQLHFRDSYLIMQTPLDSLKKAFNLDVQEKMFFPYLFCKKQNINSRLDHLPDEEDYIPTSMKEEKYNKFITWYNANKNSPFVLADALAEYCENDTEILMKSVLAMRKILLKITSGYDIMARCYSVAGMAMSVYRSVFLMTDVIGIVPEGGYERADKASDQAIKLMEWLSAERKLYIKHAGNGGEFKIDKWKVDGYIPNQKKVIEFLGCFYHSHPQCVDATSLAPNRKLHSENYKHTLLRLDAIRNLGYDIETVWECELQNQLKENKEMSKFFGDCQTRGAIKPKDAFFGGRTMAHKLYEKSTPEKEITYLDIISLYPFINYSVEYPIGHPKIIYPKKVHVDWTSPKQIEHDGIYKVRIIAPRRLFLPVLPERFDDEDPRLLFSLCTMCAKNKMAECTHNDKERSWTTTMSSIELKEALRAGYKISHCYRIWKYDKFCNLFKEYVQTFMKMKIESSGFPATIKTEQEKQQWAEDYKNILGINIDLSKVSLNPGLRFISKLLLNSLWGKFGQRNNLSHTKLCNTPDDYFSLILDKRYKIHQIIPLSNNILRVTFKDQATNVRESAASNIVVALWTTSAARLRLYEFMKKIASSEGCQVLYTDTDSIIFSHPRGLSPIKEGCFLGEMSKEYEDYEIIEIVCAGPKQYALMLRHKISGEIKIVMKVRGITLDRLNNNVLSYERFKQMVLSEESDVVDFHYTRIGPDKANNILSRKQTKIYRPINTKGFVKDLLVFPYGF